MYHGLVDVKSCVLSLSIDVDCGIVLCVSCEYLNHVFFLSFFFSLISKTLVIKSVVDEE